MSGPHLQGIPSSKFANTNTRILVLHYLCTQNFALGVPGDETCNNFSPVCYV